MSMIDKVSQYCKTFIHRFNHVEFNANKHTFNNNITSISGLGTIIYVPSRNGFFGIRDDNQNEYYLINIESYSPLIKDRQRIYFVLEPMSHINNVERWGKTARLLSLNIIN